MLHRIGNKLRQQIHIFYRELCTSMVQVSSLLVEETIIGIDRNHVNKLN